MYFDTTYIIMLYN